MIKWSKKEFSIIEDDPKHENWDKFTERHGFNDWNEMATCIYKIKKWDGMIDYETYSTWFDIYNSPLYKIMQENT